LNQKKERLSDKITLKKNCDIKMEKGFELINTKDISNNISNNNNEKIYLLKLPKSLNIDSLNDIKFKIKAKNNNDNNNIIYNDDNIEVCLEDVDAFNIMCPILSNKNTGLKFGNKFDGAININEVITTTNNNNNDNNNDNIDDILEGLPIKLAYGKIKQTKNLSITYMPIGSLSTISEIQERKKNSKIKKVNDNDNDNDNTSSNKKEKKKRKDKDKDDGNEISKSKKKSKN